MARKKPTKPNHKPEDWQSQILPEAPDDLGYEAAGPQHLSDEDLGLDEILAQLGTAKIGEATPNHTVAPVQVVAAAVPLADRVDLAAADAQDSMLQRLLQSALKDFDEVGKEVLDKWRVDRHEVQEVIDHLKDAVINRAVQNAAGSVPGVYIESLVKALEVKGNMSLTAVKAMDAKTRLLAALRGGVNILNQQNNVTPSGELERVLAGPVDDDFAGKG